MMKNCILCFAMVIAFGGLGFAFGWLAPTRKPSSQFSTNVFDFGKVPANQRVSKVLQIKNNGKGNLVIKGIQTGCGCTEVSVTPGAVIGPGETGELTATMTLDKGNAESGKVTDIYVFTNDPDNSVVRLIARAEPLNEDAGFPKILDFGNVQRSDLPITKRLIRSTSDLVASEWEAMLTDTPFIEFKPLITDDRNGGVEVRINNSAPTGELYIRFRMAKKDSDVCEEILLRANVLGEAITIPGMISMGPIYESNPIASERVRIRDRIDEERAGKVPIEERVGNVTLSKSLEKFVTCNLVAIDGKLFAMIVFLSSAEAFLSPQTIVGAASFDVSRANGQIEQLNLPVVLTVSKPRKN